MGRIWENQECLAKSERELRVKNLGKIWESQRQNLEVLQGEFSERRSMGGGGSWTKNRGIQLCLTGGSRLSPSSPPQYLHLVAPLRNGGTRGIRDMSSAVAPEGNESKWGKLLQFLAGRFYDVEALREYLFQKQVSKIHQKNR